MSKKNNGKIADKNEICEHLTEFLRNPEYSDTARLGAARELVKLVGYTHDSEPAEELSGISDDRFR